MTYQARIDGITIDANDNITIDKTEGEILPTAASGQGVNFGSRAELLAAIANAEETVSALLWLIRLGKAYKADPSLGGTFQSVAKASPASVIDLTGAATTLTP